MRRLLEELDTIAFAAGAAAVAVGVGMVHVPAGVIAAGGLTMGLAWLHARMAK